MSINVLYIGIIIIAILVSSLVVIYNKVFPYLEEKNRLREKEIKNEKFKLFKDISADMMNEELEKYIEKSVNRYIVYKFISNKTAYIGSEETETMILDLTKFITIDISELYIFYASMITSINNEEDLVRFIKNKVQNKTIEAVSNFNKSEQILNL